MQQSFHSRLCAFRNRHSCRIPRWLFCLASPSPLTQKIPKSRYRPLTWLFIYVLDGLLSSCKLCVEGLSTLSFREVPLVVLQRLDRWTVTD
ncbi:hypothetical protein K445DRAFT_161542 [Daldinia sp. EC12]|nr:hypothetical protein K445DRAFT_161542 [Daldinia sp. EC12]